MDKLLMHNLADMNHFSNLPFEKQYSIALHNLLEHGTISKDRTGVGTKRIQSQKITINNTLEYPILQGKKMNFQSAFVEMIWIMLGRTDLTFLKENGVNYWDSWVGEDGTFGPIYGKQMRNFGGIDQLRDVVNQLRNNPDSRRIMISLWNPIDLSLQKLPPCFLPLKNAVRLNNGNYEFIEDLKIGDKVLTEDSTYQKVTDTMITPYNGETFIIKHKLNTYGIECTPNHPFLVKDKGYVDASKLEVGDYLGITNNYDEIKTTKYINYFTQNGKEKTEFFSKPEEWYFMGYFLGNGYVDKNSIKRKYFICIPNFKRDLILSKINGCVSLGIINNSGINVKKFQGANYKWWNLLQEFESGAKNKKIPDFITNSSPELIEKFLEGYMDADGCEKDNFFAATTISKNIAYGIQSLYSKLNIQCKIHFIEKPTKTIILEREVNQNNVYSIYVYKNKQENVIYVENSKIKWTKITEIEKSNYNGNVYNISVENNHTYTVNNIINHNCHFLYQFSSYVNNDNIRVMDLHVMQRSADSFLGVPYDFMLFSDFGNLISYLVNIPLNKIHCTFNDFHMYLNHEEQVRKYLDNYDNDKQNIISNYIKRLYINTDTENSQHKIQLKFDEELIFPNEFVSYPQELNVDYLLDSIVNSDFKFLQLQNYENNHYPFIKAEVAV